MINPDGMTAIEWTDQMSSYLPSVLPMKINSENEWREWARHVLSFPEIARFTPPDPGQFTDWREWADRFNETVQLD
jgi:acetyl-CoA carboxylase carboxyltransferase component